MERAATPQRQARGQRRRLAIADAALRVAEREGVDAVTHRKVATEAGVPLASTTYYFDSLQELLESALERLIDREAEILRGLAGGLEGARISIDDGIEALIGWLAALVRDERQAQLSQFELYLRVARTGGRSRSWTEPYLEVARGALVALGSPEPGVQAQMVLAICDGLAIHQLTDPRDDYAQNVLGPTLRAWRRQAFG